MPALRCIPNLEDMTTDAQRKRRLLIFGGALLAVIAIVAIVIAVSSGGDSGTTSTTTAAKRGTDSSGLKAVAAVQSEFAGIPQSKNTLGSPKAPATLMVFADLQCPFCAQWENNALPGIVKRYVKAGKLKVVFQPIAILGNDSVLGARASAAAALQNKMFNYNALVYRNQGQENSGYMTTDYLKKIATATAGMDAAKLSSDIAGQASNAIVTQAQNLATSGHVDSTPSFFISKNGQPLQQLQATDLTAEAFYGPLDKLTG